MIADSRLFILWLAIPQTSGIIISTSPATSSIGIPHIQPEAPGLFKHSLYLGANNHHMVKIKLEGRFEAELAVPSPAFLAEDIFYLFASSKFQVFV